MTPSTIVGVKFCSTQALIWPAWDRLTPCPENVRPRAMNHPIFPSATQCWNWANVGDGSVPLKPPIGITGSPVASW